MEYSRAWDLQKELHEKRRRCEIPDVLLFTEHPHTYTIGKTGSESHLLADEKQLREKGIRVFRIDRGGDITYHGPGQVVGYPIFDLHGFYLDVHRFLRDLEEVLIRMLAEFGLQGRRIPGLTGVWVNEAKVAAIGIKVSRWITMHGFALNVNADLSYFGSIIPCGITNRPVTSMRALVDKRLDVSHVQDVIAEKFRQVFQIDLLERRLNDIEIDADILSKRE